MSLPLLPMASRTALDGMRKVRLVPRIGLSRYPRRLAMTSPRVTSAYETGSGWGAALPFPWTIGCRRGTMMSSKRKAAKITSVTRLGP